MSWKSVALGTLCSIKTGKKDVNEGSPNGEYPFFTCASKHTYSDFYSFDCEAILIAGNGAVGQTSYYNGKFEAYQRTYVLCNFVNVLPKYLLYVLNGNLIQELSNKVLGNTIPYIKKGMLTDFQVPLPSLATQQKIVGKLDTIFAEIDRATVATEANVKNAEALFQSYLIEVFERGGEGWSKTKLKDIAEYFNGLTYTPKDVSDEGTVVLRSSNVQQDKIELDDIVRVSSPIKEKLYVRNGDILMCSRNGSQHLVGKTATIGNLDERMTFGTFMMVIRGDSNFFIEWFFKSSLFKRQIVAGENTMINQITRYMLDDVVIPMPDIDTQKFISEKIFNLYKTSSGVKKAYQKKLIELDLYKKSILKQAFNGELVKE